MASRRLGTADSLKPPGRTWRKEARPQALCRKRRSGPPDQTTAAVLGYGRCLVCRRRCKYEYDKTLRSFHLDSKDRPPSMNRTIRIGGKIGLRDAIPGSTASKIVFSLRTGATPLHRVGRPRGFCWHLDFQGPSPFLDMSDELHFLFCAAHLTGRMIAARSAVIWVRRPW